PVKSSVSVKSSVPVKGSDSATSVGTGVAVEVVGVAVLASATAVVVGEAALVAVAVWTAVSSAVVELLGVDVALGALVPDDAVVAMGAPVGREVAVARAATGTRAGALQALSESSASAPRRTASRKMRRSVMYIVVLLCRGSAVGKKVGAVESSAAPIRTTF